MLPAALHHDSPNTRANLSTITARQVGSQLHITAGSTYDPEGNIEDARGERLPNPADLTSLLRLATCSALCNDSLLYYDASEYIENSVS